MNELVFFIHLFIVVAFAYGASRLGKEALTTWVAVQALLANLFVIKQTTLFGLEATCSDGYAVGSILGLNLLQEKFGRRSAVKATKVCFYLMVFFVLASQVHLRYAPSPFDDSQATYAALLNPAPRLLGASLATFFLVQQFDVRFFSFLKKHLPRAPLSLRNLFSLAVSQFLDTALFSYLGLFGQVDNLWQIIAISFIVKLLFIAPASLSLSFNRKEEHRDAV